MRYTPPLKINSFKLFKKKFHKTFSFIAVISAFNSGVLFAAPGEIINNEYLLNDPGTDGGYDQYRTGFTEDATFDSIHLDNFTPPNTWNQHAISINNAHGATLTITGDTYIRSYTDSPESGDGTYAITAGDYHNKVSGVVDLQGNIDIIVEHAAGIHSKYGANAIYSSYEGSTIYLGSKGTTTRIWVFEAKPDAISAKLGGDVIFRSTNNQIVGSFDLFCKDKGPGDHSSEVRGTFSGQNSYWFGDDSSNANLNFFGKLLDENNGVLDITIEKGAQWSYLGLGNPVNITDTSEVSMAHKKRISNITLRDGGIVNLADEVLLGFWDQIGLLEHMDDYSVVHDLVAIGDLKGNGGIFRLDLNGEDKSQSDVVFIENSTDPGTHSLEPYQLDKLESISPENTLIFAFVHSDAKDIKFTDKVNLEGESLYDYELTIDSDTITNEDLKRDEIDGKDVEGLSLRDYLNGTKWFIKRVDLTQSAAALSMTGAGYAAYDAAVEMDRRDRRLLQTFKDETTGLWVRARHGERGVDSQYNYQLDGAAVGIDRALSDTATLGLSFSYEQGDTDFESVRGNGDMKRYELAVYNTYDYGAPYIDLVGRLGMVSSDYETYNRSGTLKTTGDFDQKYAALSAEVGYTLKDTNGVFIEPQLQVQVTYLDGYDYSSDRQMEVDVDSDVAVLSRIGLRAGKEIASSSVTGEIYGRADVYHQFTDGQDAVFSDPTHQMRETWGTNKTFASIGLGSMLKINDQWGVQLDVEKNLGGKTIDSWLITGQAKYQF